MSSIGIILHGITGRMGTNQHLIRSIKAIRDQGGLKLSNGELVKLNVFLSGRNEEKLSQLAQEHNFANWTTDLNFVLANPQYQIFFDSASTKLRAENIKKALSFGKHIYCEKPSAATYEEAKELFLLAKAKGVKHGVVQDKLFLPGLLKLKRLLKEGVLGRVLSVKIDFGYWVFTGEDKTQPCQRPAWNKLEEGGSIIIDMMCHWQYIIKNLFGGIESLVCTAKTHIKTRYENGKPYQANADDACYSIVHLKNGGIVQISADWCTRVRRDDLATFQVDGEKGSAFASLSDCFIQLLKDTPRPVWNPDEKQEYNFFNDWKKVFTDETFDNGFKLQWELFLRHVLEDAPWNYGLDQGAEAVQFAELALKSWKEKKWLTL